MEMRRLRHTLVSHSSDKYGHLVTLFIWQYIVNNVGWNRDCRLNYENAELLKSQYFYLSKKLIF